MPNRRQTITWTNGDQNAWRHMVSLGLEELTLSSFNVSHADLVDHYENCWLINNQMGAEIKNN